jgi:peptide-methionine (R)-S-oxide reductase
MGHVFEGEGETETNERHCVNSVSVKYVDAPIPEGLLEAKVVGDAAGVPIMDAE